MVAQGIFSKIRFPIRNFESQVEFSEQHTLGWRLEAYEESSRNGRQLVSVALIKYFPQKQRGKKRGLTSTLEAKEGTQRQKRKQKPWRKAANCLVPMTCLADFLIQTRTTCSGVALPQKDWDVPHQSYQDTHTPTRSQATLMEAIPRLKFLPPRRL